MSVIAASLSYPISMIKLLTRSSLRSGRAGRFQRGRLIDCINGRQAPIWSEMPARRRILVGLSLVATYVVAGRLGMLLAVPPGYATAIFPPAGVAVAAMFIGGPATLPWTFLGSLILNFWIGSAAFGRIDLLVGADAVVIAAASTVQACVGGWSLRSLVGYPATLDHGRQLARFFIATPFLCLISATLSLSALYGLGAVVASDLPKSWLFWWIGDTLGVLLLMPIAMILAGEPRTLWRHRAVPVGIPLLAFFALFVAIFVRVSTWENEQSLLEFRLLSQQLRDKVHSQLTAQEVFLEQLNRTVVGSAGLSREEFHRHSEGLLQRFPSIQALVWAPLVTNPDRPSFEQNQQTDHPGFQIRENDAGSVRRADDRSRYFPVIYVEPSEGNEPAVGFDLGSEPDRRAAIERSIATKSVAATSPIRLVQEKGEQSGMLLVSAVLAGREAQGVLVVVLRIGTFMESVLGSAGQFIDAELVDVDQNQVLYGTMPHAAARSMYRGTFGFAGRQYAIFAAPSAAYLATHRSWQSMGVLIAGVFSTSLLGALLLLGTGERSRFATLLAERTRERDRIWQVSEDLLGVRSFQGYFLSTNPAWERTLGWTHDEIAAMHVDALRHPDDIAAAHEALARLAAGVNPIRIENRFRCKDGSYRWIYWTLTAEKGSIYVIGRDITADKQAAQSLAHAEEQLRQLQKMESVGQLTGGIAHDFNNLLTAVLGNLEIARSRVTDEQTATLLAGAARAAERGARLVEQLLAFSRKQNLRLVAVDINQLIAGMREMLNRSIGASVKIDQHLASDLWAANADPNQIELAVLNLAINARDAMPVGGTLLIETVNSPAGDHARPSDLPTGDYVCIAVSDTGTGMSESVMARALEPFFTTKELGKGSGLGLSMVHGVAKQSGGGISLSSRLGRGTTVRVYLPRASEAAVHEKEPQAAGLPAQAALRGKVVLLIDDDPDVREITETQLIGMGCRVVTAESGRSGLELLDREPLVDVAMIDFAMPGMNGLEVAKHITSRRPGLPIVIVTGYADVDLSAEDRPYAFLHKPFQRTELASALTLSLGGADIPVRLHAVPDG